MDPAHRRIINEQTQNMIGVLDFDRIQPLLLERKVFNKNMIDHIVSFKIPSEQMAFMLKELPTRGPDAFEKFIAILLETNEPNIAIRLDPSLKDKLNSGNSIIDIWVDYGDKIFLGEDIYKMTSSPRGLCLIINNVNFDKKEDCREGSDLDASKFNSLFTKLGYYCIIETDLKGIEMEELLEDFAHDSRHKHMDSSIVIILSHGGENIIYGIDGKYITEEQLLFPFNNSTCRYLRNKPKVFLIQACRGSSTNIPILDKNEVFDAKKEVSDANVKKIAQFSDVLIFYPTLLNYKAVRNKETGSWLCEAIVNVFGKHAKDTNLPELLTKVTRIIGQKTSNYGYKTSCESKNQGWDKLFFFNPGHFDGPLLDMSQFDS